ncbi:uncharacterized protein LOC143251990 [Tachypleus tridentatus]|uniref:uncharacterized protein LOC143251990 n=1 Tax=Tachypleus tridentatus TaxID=6853 RepID=UPI003FD25F2B
MEREKWLNILQEASRITWKNSQLSEIMIKELECQGLQLSKEKQKYFHKLQEETIALRDEIDKNEELEKITAELEKEKKKLQEMIFQFQEEHQQTFKELEETAEALKILEDQNCQLKQTTDMLQTTLQDLAEERERTLELLKKRDQENLELFCTTEELQKDLKEIEEETQMLLQEKQELEAKVTNNEMQAKMLEEEKQIFSEQADHLLSSLNDLEAQKEVTETELKEEIIARMSAERKLKEAEESLQRLEVGLKCDSTSLLMREKLLPDVKNLKKYFEHIAEEARIDADKPFIMKNAILARKAYIQRVRTLRLKSAREEKERYFANIFPEQKSSDCRLRRTQSVSLTNTAQQKIKTLHRTMSTRAARISVPPLRELGKPFPPLKE